MTWEDIPILGLIDFGLSDILKLLSIVIGLILIVTFFDSKKVGKIENTLIVVLGFFVSIILFWSIFTLNFIINTILQIQSNFSESITISLLITLIVSLFIYRFSVFKKPLIYSRWVNVWIIIILFAISVFTFFLLFIFFSPVSYRLFFLSQDLHIKSLFWVITYLIIFVISVLLIKSRFKNQFIDTKNILNYAPKIIMFILLTSFVLSTSLATSVFKENYNNLLFKGSFSSANVLTSISLNYSMGKSGVNWSPVYLQNLSNPTPQFKESSYQTIENGFLFFFDEDKINRNVIITGNREINKTYFNSDEIEYDKSKIFNFTTNWLNGSTSFVINRTWEKSDNVIFYDYRLFILNNRSERFVVDKIFLERLRGQRCEQITNQNYHNLDIAKNEDNWNSIFFEIYSGVGSFNNLSFNFTVRCIT